MRHACFPLSALFAVFLTVCAEAHQTLPSQRFIPGEVIVKFSPETEASDVVAHAAKEDARDDVRLNSYLDFLSEKVRIPLRVKRFTSGGEVVFTIQQELLASRLEARLRNHPQVARLWRSDTDKKAGTAARGEIILEFAEGSQEAKILAKGREKELQKWTRALEQDLGIRLGTRVTRHDHLVVVIEMHPLTLELVERLKKQKDVEYAQPNRLFGLGPPTR